MHRTVRYQLARDRIAGHLAGARRDALARAARRRHNAPPAAGPRGDPHDSTHGG
jgi:hypothetical protein